MEKNEDKEAAANKALFEKQRQMLLTFANNGAITKEYSEREIAILKEKMHLDSDENTTVS